MSEPVTFLHSEDSPLTKGASKSSHCVSRGERFLALAGDDYLSSADDLQTLLSELEAAPPDADVVVWDRCQRIAAVLVSGKLTVYQPVEPAPAPAPVTPAWIEKLPDRVITKGRQTIMGLSPTALCAWCGANGFTITEVRKVMSHYKATKSDKAIGVTLSQGRNGKYHPLPTLSAEQAAELRRAAGK